MSIFALATAPGTSGLAVIRVSGKEAFKVAKTLTKFKKIKPRMANFSSFYNHKNKIIDKGIFIFFPKPNSYTGDDVVEFHIHGSNAVIKYFLKTLSNFKNCRLAKPGEFTKTALLNKKINLLQAESLIDLINSETELQRIQALKVMNEDTTKVYTNLRDEMIKILSDYEAVIDFSDDEVGDNVFLNNRDKLLKINDKIKQIILKGENSEKIREGFKISIIGPTNSGKSSLINCLSNRQVSIVSNIPGTTRDSIHTHYKLFGKEFVLIDTAGLRKKKNVHEDLEFYSVIRAIRAMDEADICLLVIDALNGITMQDINIFSLAARKGKGIVILINKWDAFEKETNTARDYEQKIKEKIAPFNDVPVIFISAMDKTRIFQAMEKTIEVHENQKRRIQTSKLNEALLKDIQRFPPPMSRGHNVSIKFVRQLPTKTPSFAFYANYPDALSSAYRNFLENKLRGHYKFSGVPLRVYFRKK
jgi:ribosome-associated GTPase EngA